MSFETHFFFPFWERTKNVLWDTNDFNIDSLIGTKKMSALFQSSCLSQSGVIVHAKVSDRQRRCCAPRWDLSLSDNDSVCYLAPAARYSSQFTFHVFFPKTVFGFTQALRRIFRRTEVGFLPHLIVEWSVQQFRNTNGFVSAVWWILSFGTQITSLREQKMSFETHYSSLWLSTVLS